MTTPSATQDLPSDWRDLAAALARAHADRVPVSLPDGFAVQCSEAQALQIGALHAHHLGGHVAAYKLGATNLATQAAMGLAGPFHGLLLADRVHASPARLPRNAFFLCVVEAEIAVRLARPLGGDGVLPTRAQVVAAIDTLMPALEIADTRLLHWKGAANAAILADLGFSGALVLGAPASGWQDLELAAATVGLDCNGVQVRSGSGGEVLGHPLDALALHVQAIGRLGRRLEPGDIVSTGAWTALYPAAAGSQLYADFGPLGAVSLRLD